MHRLLSIKQETLALAYPELPIKNSPDWWRSVQEGAFRRARMSVAGQGGASSAAPLFVVGLPVPIDAVVTGRGMRQSVVKL